MGRGPGGGWGLPRLGPLVAAVVQRGGYCA